MSSTTVEPWRFHIPISRFLILSCILPLAYFVFLGAYRVTFHPLAKYPGPFVHKLSFIPNFLDAYSGDRHLRNKRYHELYGPIVRIGPNTLSFQTASALHSIYGSQSVNNKKGKFYEIFGYGSGGYSTHSQVDKATHAFRRRVISNGFSETAIRSAEPFILENLERLCDLVGKGADSAWSPSVNFHDSTLWFSFDTMGDLSFGKHFGCLEGSVHRSVPKLMQAFQKLIYPVGQFASTCDRQLFIDIAIQCSYQPWFFVKGLLIHPSLQPYLSLESAKRFNEYAARTLQQRLDPESVGAGETKNSRKDVLHYITTARDPETGEGLPWGSLHAEARLLIIAGSETVATTMCNVFFYLSRNPARFAKATAEIRNAFDSKSAVRIPAVNYLPYLNACIDEAMRITPPVPGPLDRVVLPGGLTIDGEHIPQGTTIGVGTYTIHHDAQYFPDPYSYVPERWIVDKAEGVTAQDVEKAQWAFCPFSHGNRACIGKGLAYAELRLSLARLIYEFDVRLTRGGVTGGGDPKDPDPARRRVDEYQARDFFVSCRVGPELQFRRV